MKNKNDRTGMVNKGMGMMAAVVLTALLMAGCGQNNGDTESARDTNAGSVDMTEAQRAESNIEAEESSESYADTENITQLEVRFGDNGEAFMMTLLDNETAAAIARYVGTSDWRLPIYERDADADYSVLQYYDIPSRYEIPSDHPETVTEAKAGDVFYSDPNRIVLFYHDFGRIYKDWYI